MFLIIELNNANAILQIFLWFSHSNQNLYALKKIFKKNNFFLDYIL